METCYSVEIVYNDEDSNSFGLYQDQDRAELALKYFQKEYPKDKFEIFHFTCDEWGMPDERIENWESGHGDSAIFHT